MKASTGPESQDLSSAVAMAGRAGCDLGWSDQCERSSALNTSPSAARAAAWQVSAARTATRSLDLKSMTASVIDR
jgi:hypothetical protein